MRSKHCIETEEKRDKNRGKRKEEQVITTPPSFINNMSHTRRKAPLKQIQQQQGRPSSKPQHHIKELVLFIC